MQVLWRVMHEAGKEYLVNCGPRWSKEAARRHFKEAAYEFDRALRRTDREYRQTQMAEIECFETEDPRKF